MAGFVMWQINPGFMARHFMVSPQHIREGRVYTLLTSGEMPPNVFRAHASRHSGCCWFPQYLVAA